MTTAPILRQIQPGGTRERFFVSEGWRIWEGEDWFIGPDRRWHTSSCRYFQVLNPFDWWRYFRRNWPAPAVRPLTLFERTAEPTRSLDFYTAEEYAENDPIGSETAFWAWLERIGWRQRSG